MITTENTERTEMKTNGLTGTIIAAAIVVHRELGPGLLESAYEACLAYEPREQGLNFERQKSLPVEYKRHRIDCGYRLDFLVEERVIVEIKSVKSLEPIHEAQLLSYLRLSGYKTGLLVNSNVRLLKDGIRRLLNGTPQ